MNSREPGTHIVMRLIALSICAFTAQTVIGSEQNQSMNSPDEIVAIAVRERQKIHQGRVVFEVSGQSGKDVPASVKTRYSIVFRGEKLQVTREDLAGAHPGNRKLIFTPEHVAFHTDDQGPRGERAAFVVGENRHMTNQVESYRHDPRILGMMVSPVQIQVNGRIGALLQHKQQQSLSVQAFDDGGTAALYVKYHLPNSAIVTAVIWPESGHTILRGQIAMKNSRGEIIDSLEAVSQPQPVLTKTGAVDTVWFPTSTMFQRSLDGTIGLREEVTVQSADFLTPVSDDEFKLSRMNIRPGTDILERPESFGIGNRTGLELVPGGDRTQKPVELAYGNRSRTLEIVAIVVSILSIISAVYVIRTLRNRSIAAHPNEHGIDQHNIP